MNFLDLIERKKRGEAIDRQAVRSLVSGFTSGRIPEYQMAAFLMAVWFRGLTAQETIALTDAMLHSGRQLDLSHLPGPTADKHSTGGVGDKVSLLLAPLAAACGLQVPMLSGRGLGHTAGTLDKLEAIPGYRIFMPNDRFIATVGAVGCAIVGQSDDIAPADGKIYALRDVTATIDCVPLITASILSKKLAAGPETIVIDLKTGSGAFMSDLSQARALARSMRETAANWDRRMAVVFSDMSQPLGHAVGHANETVEAFATLRSDGRKQGPPDLVTLTEELVAEMLTVSGHCGDMTEARDLIRDSWDSGRAFAKMMQWIEAQNGRLDPDRDDFGLDIAPKATEVSAPADGYVAEIACREVGKALGDLGGARRRVEESLDLSAGIDFLVKVGDRLQKGQPLAVIFGRQEERVDSARHRLLEAVTLSEEPVAAPPLILSRLGPLDTG